MRPSARASRWSSSFSATRTCSPSKGAQSAPLICSLALSLNRHQLEHPRFFHSRQSLNRFTLLSLQAGLFHLGEGKRAAALRVCASPTASLGRVGGLRGSAMASVWPAGKKNQTCLKK